MGVDYVIKYENEHGAIKVSRDVLTLLTGDAATNCFGVKGMTIRSVTDGLVHLLKRESMGKGVHVKRNVDDTLAIKLHIAVDQEVNIPAICESIIDEVRYKVKNSTGADVKRIDVFVDSIMIG
jgi:uncharacterized alkaline shock family protein YloU